MTKFHDWYSSIISRAVIAHNGGTLKEHPLRRDLPDDARVVFTHNDLNFANILVSRNGLCKVLAIIDWHQSGWYPSYWEYCKTFMVAHNDGEEIEDWKYDYLPKILDMPRPETYFAWQEFNQGLS